MDDPNLHKDVAQLEVTVQNITNELNTVHQLVTQISADLNSFRLESNSGDHSREMHFEKAVNRIQAELREGINENAKQIAGIKIIAGVIGTAAGSIPLIVLKVLEVAFGM